MVRPMKTIAVLSLILTIAFSVVYSVTAIKLFMTLAITSGTIAYHFCMRLIVGFLFNIFMRNKADYNLPWFQVGKAEQRLYQKLNVRRWKRFIPTYDVEAFDPSLHSWDEIAQAMCQAELVHETIIVLSFVPIVFSVWFGSLGVFVITSVLAACIDLVFVIIQRYNRPRVIRMINRRKNI